MRRRIIDAVELVALSGLIAWIVTPLFAGLAAGLPYPAAPALAALFAAAGAIVAAARLRRRSRRDRARAAKSTTDVPSALAYAGIGLLAGGLLSGDWMSLGGLAGAKLAAAYPGASVLVGIALVTATIVLLVHQSERRTARPAIDDRGDPWVERMESIFDTGAVILGLAFALGIGVLLVTFVARSWIRTYPWSLIAVALFAAYLLWEGLRDRRRNPKPVAATVKEFGQALAIVLVLAAVVTVILESNYRGFTESSAAFSTMPPPTRLAFFAMPAAFLGLLVFGLARFAYSGLYVRVFISFHHSREETAIELERALVERGLIVGRIPFRRDGPQSSFAAADLLMQSDRFGNLDPHRMHRRQ
jgi:hypothetical protein